jgi:hypothetical protein
MILGDWIFTSTHKIYIFSTHTTLHSFLTFMVCDKKCAVYNSYPTSQLSLIFCSFTTIYYPRFSRLIQLEDSYFFSLLEKFQTLIGWLQSLIFSLSSCSRTLIRHVSLSHSILYLFYFTFSFWTTC